MLYKDSNLNLFLLIHHTLKSLCRCKKLLLGFYFGIDLWFRKLLSIFVTLKNGMMGSGAIRRGLSSAINKKK